MNDFLVLDMGALRGLFSDGPQILDSLVASGQKVLVAETVLAELMAQACDIDAPLSILQACDWVIENLTGVDYAGTAAIYAA